MSHIGNALNARKGRAVASFIGNVKDKFNLNQKFNLNRKFNFGAVWKLVFAIIAALAFTRLAHATGSDLLASQNSTVTGTFGQDSSLVKWFYIAEVIIAVFLYIKTRSPLVFVGIVLAVIFTKVGFGLASQ